MRGKVINAAVVIAALGYFVDIYDLILFSIVRVKSLKAIGVPEDLLLADGVFLLNMQMSGMLLGGILWGILGDKRGRLSVLIGSIFLYSAANIANAFVQTIDQYAVLRFIAGVGLAGELGAGIALVSESLSKDNRMWGTTIIATVGILGAIAAALVGDYLDWRTAYFIGGVMGLGLLMLRIKVNESAMFIKSAEQNIKRGSLSLIFKSRENIFKYCRCVLIGVPIWFVVGILITFAPEFSKAFGMSGTVSAGRAVMFAYMGLAVGDLVSGSFAQLMKSRKKVMAIFLVLNAFFILAYLYGGISSLVTFYALCFCLGFASGYWAVFVTIAAEQFGTNIRSTVATTVPNFVRGALVPLTFCFTTFKNSFGIVNGTALLAGLCVLAAFFALVNMEETHAKDLDYLE